VGQGRRGEVEDRGQLPCPEPPPQQPPATPIVPVSSATRFSSTPHSEEFNSRHIARTVHVFLLIIPVFHMRKSPTAVKSDKNERSKKFLLRLSRFMVFVGLIGARFVQWNRLHPNYP
jgi:hypothetical protein